MTGSLVNLISGNSQQPTPEVGMGATVLQWTDRSAATIVEVAITNKGVPKAITIQYDNSQRTDSNGMSESQTYDYTPNPHGSKVEYTLRKNGAWVRRGDPLKGGQRVAIGYRDTYHDYSF
jgi:hypothetical protein